MKEPCSLGRRYEYLGSDICWKGNQGFRGARRNLIRFWKDMKKSVLLVRSRGKLKLALKFSAFGFLGGGVSYFDLGMESLPKLRRMIDEAEQIANANLQGAARP